MDSVDRLEKIDSTKIFLNSFFLHLLSETEFNLIYGRIFGIVCSKLFFLKMRNVSLCRSLDTIFRLQEARSASLPTADQLYRQSVKSHSESTWLPLSGRLSVSLRRAISQLLSTGLIGSCQRLLYRHRRLQTAPAYELKSRRVILSAENSGTFHFRAIFGPTQLALLIIISSFLRRSSACLL